MKFKQILNETNIIVKGVWALEESEDGRSSNIIAIVTITKDSEQNQALVNAIKKAGGDYKHPEFYSFTKRLPKEPKKIKI